MSGISFGGSGRGISFGASGFLNSTSLSSNPLGRPPTYFNLSTEMMDEGLSVGSVVAMISGDGDLPVTYSITNDPDGKFVLDANGTDIRLEAAIDYATKQFHDLQILAQNAAGSCSSTVRIAVTEAAAAVTAPTDIDLSAFSVLETALPGSTIATISADGDAPVVFSIVSDPDNKFDVQGGTNLVLTDTLDHAAATSHAVRIRASNVAIGGDFVEEDFTINVTVASAADYVVTSDAEWDAVFALPTATLEGKIIEVSGSNFTGRTIQNHPFSIAPTIRAADSNSSVPSLSVQDVGDINYERMNFRNVGWPRTYDGCFRFDGNSGSTLFDRCEFSHFYDGIDNLTGNPVPIDPSAQYTEYTRVDNNHTATTTSTAYPLNWLDASATAGWIEFFNEGGQDIYVTTGGSGVTTSTGSGTLCPAGVRTRVSNLDPTVDTHIAVVTASGTSAFNARSEIGLSSYLSSAFGGVGGITQDNVTIVDCVFKDVGNGIKRGFIKITGTAIALRNTFDRVYQDIIAGFTGDTFTYICFNTWTTPFSRSGIAQDLDGDARDPHGDLVQMFSTGLATISNALIVGNIHKWQNNRPGATAQGLFLSDNDIIPSYDDIWAIGNMCLGGSQNGISSGETLYPAQGWLLWGNLVLNPDDPTASTSIRMQTVPTDGHITYVGDSWTKTLIEEGGDIILDNSVVGTGITTFDDYFPNNADWASATTVSEILAAWSTVGGLDATVGVNAVEAALDRTVTPEAIASCVEWSLVPSGVHWEDVTSAAQGTSIALGKRRVLNPLNNQAVVPGTGVEWIKYDTDGITVLSTWSSSPGVINKDEWIDIRRTTPSADFAGTEFAVTINGRLHSVTVTTGIVLVNPFRMGGGATDTYFEDTVTPGTPNPKKVEFEMIGQTDDYDGGHVYMGNQVSNFRLEFNGSRQGRTMIEDEAGSSAAAGLGLIGHDVYHEQSYQAQTSTLRIAS